jgi:hypothetical protein
VAKRHAAQRPFGGVIAEADPAVVEEAGERLAKLRGPASVVLNELNIFTWLGYDVRPFHDTNEILIGRFPPGFTAKLMAGIKNRRHVERDRW